MTPEQIRLKEIKNRSFENKEEIGLYSNIVQYIEKSQLFINQLYDIIRCFPTDQFSEEHLRFIKADGYEYLAEELLPFKRHAGKYYDLISYRFNDRISVKVQEQIFQQSSNKLDKNGNKVYVEPRELIMTNSMGSSGYNKNDFDYLLAIQPEIITDVSGVKVIKQPFAIGLATSEKVINNGQWKGTNKDQFKTKIYNHSMKKNGMKHDMFSTICDEKYDIYRELDPKNSIINRKTQINFDVNKSIKNLYWQIYQENQ